MSIPVLARNILLSKSPIFITYNNPAKNVHYINVKLYVWSGDISLKPMTPTFNLIAYRSNTEEDSISIEVSDYISPFIEPLPNEDFFSEFSPNFGEFINVQWRIEAFVDTTQVDSINSTHYFASLGYGKVIDGPSPSLNIKDGKLIDNKKRLSTPGLIHWDVKLASTTITSVEVVDRFNVDVFKVICTKGYIPRQIMFLNKNGLLDTFTFPRVSSRKMKSTSDKYNQTTTSSTYNVSDRFNTIFNKNGNVEWVFNTDNLDDHNINVIEELYASDRHWLIDYENKTILPLQLMDDNFDRKTSIKDRGKKAYTIKFVESNDYIQNII